MSSLALLQPSYLPWVGYFQQMDAVDHFIYYDDVQYTKNDWRNRNRIKTRDGAQWLTVPVKGSTSLNINEVEIDHTKNWRNKHLQALRTNYAKAPFFSEVFEVFADSLAQTETHLSRLNVTLTEALCAYVGISKPRHLSSDLQLGGDKNERLIHVCAHFGADLYYSGKAAESYLDRSLFENKGIKVVFQHYEPTPYHQFFGDFIPYLSAVDLFFHHGKESLKIIRGAAL